MWSYLGGGVHFAFTWSVIPVIVVVIYAGTAIFCSHCLWWVVYWQGFFTAKLYLGGGVLYPCYNEFWGGGTCGGFPWCTVQWFTCVMETRCSLPCWDDEPFYFVLVWFYSLSDSGWFLCVVSLRGLWVPANLFLLYSWVITLVLRSLVMVTWSGWKLGHFKIYLSMCDLTFMFILIFVLGRLQ